MPTHSHREHIEKYHPVSHGSDKHVGHTKTENVGHGMGHGSAQNFLRRFWIVTFLLMPLVLTEPAVSTFLNIDGFFLSKWIQFGIATIIFGFAIVFFEHAWHEISARDYGMMTLVSLAVGSGYLFSVASTFISSLETQFYLEISTLIWVLLFGHYLEARSSAAAGDALKEVAKLLPSRAHRKSGEKEEDVPVSELQIGDTVIVKPGEKVPADGIVLEGAAFVNESLLTGESTPVLKKNNDTVIAGSIVSDSVIVVMVERVGEHSTVGQIQTLVFRAQETKPRVARIADRAARALTIIAGVTALGALLVWFFILGESFVFAATLAITVLVIACPHALGLAIPTVTTITMSLAAKNGLFIKNLAKLETLRRADVIVMDKTGTLTEGVFGVSRIVTLGAFSDNDVLKIAAAIDAHSSHAIARAVVAEAKARGINLPRVNDFSYLAGKGSRAVVDGVTYAVGNASLTESISSISQEARDTIERLSQDGQTIAIIVGPSGVVGVIGLSDTIKKDSFTAVSEFHKRGIQVMMLSGDNESVTASVARQLGIDDFAAHVRPEDKYNYVSRLQKKGRIVVMAGDGINDAPALTQSDVGVAIGAGTDVAVEAGDVVLTRSNPLDIVRLIDLSRAVYSKMIQNLVWALGYNIVAIPAAAGIFSTWGFFIRPEIGALVMSFSTVIVVINALALKRVDLRIVS